MLRACADAGSPRSIDRSIWSAAPNPHDTAEVTFLQQINHQTCPLVPGAPPLAGSSGQTTPRQLALRQRPRPAHPSFLIDRHHRSGRCCCRYVPTTLSGSTLFTDCERWGLPSSCRRPAQHSLHYCMRVWVFGWMAKVFLFWKASPCAA